ncbi:hypothetical protein Vretimale_3015 [Volvox reticuliferus]|uniref:BAG domain-containing protein n=1 Tax=Volvox reticuliferus TaxID=1737510 RepID=A0A8J4D7P6_9CHLO|nr:hypothetical protein Vretifemale_6817 [Volvox reticuliferus]GIL77341.1 hypothetical protein Vretifemale_6817 [Volvox reticuliferus]GIL97361.1 hypothetical protein Vretimale_3015 [Volvox reticuliferus]
MFHMASPWDSWGLYSGHNAYPWASNAGSHRKRAADIFDMRRAWFDEESDDSDLDSYVSDDFRTRAAPVPRRGARQPQKEMLYDPMTGRRFRATPRDAPTGKAMGLSPTAATVGTETTTPNVRGALTSASHAQRQQMERQQHHSHKEHQQLQQRTAPMLQAAQLDMPSQPPLNWHSRPAAPSAPSAIPTAGNPTRIQVRNIPVQSECTSKTGIAVPEVVPAAGVSPNPPTPRRNETIHPACHCAKVVLQDPEMKPVQAARTIQRWWRGWRLWRNKPALKVLMALSTELRNAAALFQQYLDSTNGNLTDMQQLEVNELAMRAILKLDSLEGLPQELRVLRKHLTARALRLQDEVHSAYARSTTRPAQVRHGVPAPPAAAVAAQNCTVDADGAETVTAAATPVEEGLATPEISVACDGVAAAATEEAVVEGPGASGCPSPASVASQGDQDSLSGGEGAATTACTRAAHRHSKRVRTKRGGGIDDRSISSSAGKRRSAPVSRSRGDNLNISRISGRLFQRLRRRFGASAAAVAVAAAAAAAAHLPPAASSRRGGSQGFGLDACGLRKQPRGAHKKQQQQSQQPQQQSVIVRVVVRPDAGVDGNIEEDIRSCRTALLVESGVQTD